MIVVCERCQTRFELDDAKVPPSGVRVRCSRCKHAFLVSPSSGIPAGARPAAIGADPEPETDGDWTFNVGRSSSEPDEASRAGSAERPAGDPPGGAPEPRTIDELGSPESWDFLGEGEPPLPAVEDLTEPVPAAVVSGPPPVAGPVSLRSAPAAAEPVPAETVERGAAPPERWLEGGGWLAMAALCLFALHGVLFPGSAAPRVPERVAVGGLQAERIEGRFVENAVAGRLFVVTGRLHNLAHTPTPVGGRLQLALVAGDGMRIGSPAAFVGHPVAESRLREEPPALLRESLAESARRWAEEAFGPEEARPFEAVFEDLPTEAERIVFELAPAGGAGGLAAARRRAGLTTESARTFLPSPPPSSE